MNFKLITWKPYSTFPIHITIIKSRATLPLLDLFWTPKQMKCDDLHDEIAVPLNAKAPIVIFFNYFPFFSRRFFFCTFWSEKLSREPFSGASYWQLNILFQVFHFFFSPRHAFEDRQQLKRLSLRAKWINELIIKCSLGKAFTAANWAFLHSCK